MAVTKVLARGWTFEYRPTTTWIEIKGINSFDVSPESNDVDTTDFDSNGWNENMVASRGLGLTLEGMHLEDVNTGSRDPGQAAVETLANAIGPSSVGYFRMTSPGGNVKTFYATAKTSGPGGGNDDAAKWSVELTITGQPVDSQVALITITVLPDNPTVSQATNATYQCTAIGVYENGSSRDITTLATWTSGTPATATIGANTGLATLLVAGTSIVTATLSGKTDTSTLTVTA